MAQVVESLPRAIDIVNAVAADDLVTHRIRARVAMFWPKFVRSYPSFRRMRVNSLWPCDTIWRQICVNIGSGNGLLPDGTKPLPEPMLTDHHWSPVTFISGQYHQRCLNHQSLKSVWKLHIQYFIQISQGPMGYQSKHIISHNFALIWCLILEYSGVSL